MAPIGKRLVRSGIVGNLIGMILFFLFYMGAVFINGVSNSTVIEPGLSGLFGYVIGMSASIGVELSNDLREE